MSIATQELPALTTGMLPRKESRERERETAVRNEGIVCSEMWASYVVVVMVDGRRRGWVVEVEGEALVK